MLHPRIHLKHVVSQHCCDLGCVEYSWRGTGTSHSLNAPCTHSHCCHHYHRSVFFDSSAAIFSLKCLKPKASWGIAFTLLIVCLVTYRRKLRKSRAGLYQMAYIFFMFILGTIYMVSNTGSQVVCYVQIRNFPGGPAQCNYYLYSAPITISGVVVFFWSNWMADALLVSFSLLLLTTNCSFWVFGGC